jgi:uncharacterized protein (DUF2141 family)
MLQHLKLLAIFAVLAMIATAPVFAQGPAAPPNVLRVQLDGFRNNNGQPRCSLFSDSDPAAFPRNGNKAFKIADAPTIRNASAEIVFSGIAPGKYALVCYHDENSNGKFDETVLGMPKEGYCFSNNIKPRFSAPVFGQCAFDYKGGDQAISITMIY